MREAGEEGVCAEDAASWGGGIPGGRSASQQAICQPLGFWLPWMPAGFVGLKYGMLSFLCLALPVGVPTDPLDFTLRPLSLPLVG